MAFSLPKRWLALLSILLIVGTELLLPKQAVGFVQYAYPLRLWLLPGFTESIYVLYPIMPWLGVTGLGMVYGYWLKKEETTALKSALWIGLVAVLLFIPIRWFDGFGNIRAQEGQGWIAFFNVVKYPPSILFAADTRHQFNLVGLVESCPRSCFEDFATTRHFWSSASFLLRASSVFVWLVGQWLDPQGIGLVRMFPYWLLGLLILWPLCWGYGRFKQTQSPNSFSFR